MASKNILVSLVAVLALVVLSIASVSASFGEITSVKVEDTTAEPVAIFTGDTLSVRVFFNASSNAEDVRVKAWITGGQELSTVTERFDVIAGNTYSRLLSVKVPSTLDQDDLDEALELIIVVENKNEKADEESIDLTLQRESYVVEILDVDMLSEVSAGDVLAVDVVLKNRGRHFAEDTFAVVRIPALQIEDRAYFSDLSPVDEPIVGEGSNVRQLDNEHDSSERRLFLRIPSDAPAGVYVVEVEAFNDDSITTITRRVAIVGSESQLMAVSTSRSKTFNAGETVEYNVVLVNTGNKVALFDLVVDAPAELNVEVSEPLAVVSAGSSKTVTLRASSDTPGTHSFTVNVHSGTQLVKSESFTANVQGNDIISAGSPTVLLTVVLAVIFVVLLVVLIVLLTRKPEKSEEFGESYY